MVIIIICYFKYYIEILTFIGSKYNINIMYVYGFIHLPIYAPVFIQSAFYHHIFRFIPSPYFLRFTLSLLTLLYSFSFILISTYSFSISSSFLSSCLYFYPLILNFFQIILYSYLHIPLYSLFKLFQIFPLPFYSIFPFLQSSSILSSVSILILLSSIFLHHIPCYPSILSPFSLLPSNLFIL